MRSVIVEDNTTVRKEIRALVQKYCPGIEVSGEAGSVVEAAKLIRSHRPDILFLDIELPDGTGFDLLELLDEKPHVIFITGSEEYALRAFRIAAIDYLVKPVDPEELRQAVDRIRSRETLDDRQVQIARNSIAGGRPLEKVALHTSDKIHFVDIKDIIRLEADGNYTRVLLSDKSNLFLARTLKEFDNMLKESGFLRVHQSHLINMDFIKEFIKTDGGYLVLHDGSKIPVSTRKRASIIEKLDAGR